MSANKYTEFDKTDVYGYEIEKKILELLRLCNKEQLDPVHLPQLIEDTLITATI